MALTPPNNNYGDLNNSPTGPVLWEEVQPTNNQIIDRNDMPFASTVEYKGYYKAEATGNHTFTLTGSSNVTGYAWLSSAPRNSDHIKIPDGAAVNTTLNKSFGVIIPNKRQGASYWPFEDRNVLGTNFLGYGYWPKDDYGNSTGFNAAYGPGRQDAPSNRCGFTQVAHQYLVPGDIRTYENTPVTNFGGRHAGPGWQGPEDPNFSDPCWPDGAAVRPLQRLCRSTDPRPCDSTATPNTAGKSSQVYLDTSFKAEGAADDAWAQYEIVYQNGPDFYIWPKAVAVTNTGNGKTAPERVNVRFGMTMKLPTQEYTFKFKSRDGLKMWYKLGGGDARDMIKFPDDVEGNNPCNLTAGNTGNGNVWRPGGGLDGFTGKVTIPRNTFIQFVGGAVGVPGLNQHGWSLVIEDANGNNIWDARQLLTGADNGLVGIDECGYNALLAKGDRLPQYRSTEMYVQNGWGGYVNNQLFRHDTAEGDQTLRDFSTTRQYLWSNSLTKTRGGSNIAGSVYLRQGDYYFIRVIVSNHVNQSANYQFKVAGPTGGFTQSVKFSGNGDPGSDTSVGAGTGGSGIPINKEDLCDSVLAPGGQSIDNLETNFAMVDSLKVVLNLNDLNVSTHQIGREGQAESLPAGQGTPDPGSHLILFSEDNGTITAQITISQLVRAGQGDIAPLNNKQQSAVLAAYNRQVDTNKVLTYNTFMNAITSQAVIQWGLGGNYPYIYHAVSDVIRSICGGVDIITPIRPNDTSSNDDGRTQVMSQSQTNGVCIDVDFTQLSGGAAQITSECLDECKAPNQYPMLESQYKEPAGYYDDVPDPNYKFKVEIKKNYGMVSPTAWSAPGSSSKGDYDISRAYAQKNSVKFNPGKVTAVPLTVPDVFVPDNFDIKTSSKGALECSFWFELSSNTFLYDPDNIGAASEGGTLRPYLVWWVSKGPGGIPLGDYYFTRPSYSTTPRMYATMNPEQWIYYKAQATNSFKGYLGNTNGVRWLNFAPLKYEAVQDLNFDIPLPGTTGFLNLLSVKGYTSNEIRISGTAPAPDCTSIAAGSGGSSSSNPTMKSLPNMAPYIGEEWDGNVPGHVEMATNGGYSWGAGAGVNPYPAGIGPGNQSPRLTGNAVYYPQPMNGKILSYEWLATNEKIVPFASYTWVWSPSGGQSVLSNCSPMLTVVRWFSATPGGDPLRNITGDRKIYDIGDAGGDPTFRLQQLYDVNDATIPFYYTIPVITKKYWLNAACVEQSLVSALQSAGRAPTASEVRVFSPQACGSDNSYAYVVSGPRGTIYDFQEWLQENT